MLKILCSSCGEEKGPEGFYASTLRYGRYTCKECRKARSRRWGATPHGKESRRKASLKYNNRPEIAEKKRSYQREYKQGDGKRVRREQQRRSRGLPFATRPAPDLCECCGKPPGTKALAIDHCHTTGVFRGWLCMNCNTSIGKLGDDIDGIFRAFAYLCRAYQK